MTSEERGALEGVAAMRAERDSLRVEQEKWVRRDKELVERVDSLLGERDNLRERAVSAEAEMQRLRERVEGLTASLNASLANTEEAEAVQHRLADGLAAAAEDARQCRERVKALETNLAAAREGGLTWAHRALKAESRLAAIRQRAGGGDGIGMVAAGRRWDALSDWAKARFVEDARAVAAYLIGDEALEPGGLSDPPSCSRCHGNTAEVSYECSHCDGLGYEPDSGVAAVASIVSILDRHDDGTRVRVLRFVWSHYSDTPRPTSAAPEPEHACSRYGKHSAHLSCCTCHCLDCATAREALVPKPCPECATLDGHTATCSQGGAPAAEMLHEITEEQCETYLRLRDSSVTEQLLGLVEESGLPLRFDAGGSPEPSTAAEFVAVRKSLIAAWGEENEDDHAFVAISLLERRMGAMARVIRLVAERGATAPDDYTLGGLTWFGPEAWASHGLGPGLTAKELRDALTDVPPLFSLGEIDAACAAIGSHLGSEVKKLVLLEFRQRLLALQK